MSAQGDHSEHEEPTAKSKKSASSGAHHEHANEHPNPTSKAMELGDQQAPAREGFGWGVAPESAPVQPSPTELADALAAAVASA